MLLDLFRTPSAFDLEPLKFARNQIGHAAIVGALPVMILGAWWLAPLAAIYGAWEVAQWRLHGGDDWDGLQDWAFVMCGAVAALHPVAVLPLLAYLGAGYLRRVDAKARV